MKQRELIHFCRQMAQIAHSGLGFEDGLEIVASEGKEKYIKRHRMIQKLTEGYSLVTVLKEEQLFEEEVLEMIEVGMETGNLEDVFTDLANYYERELNIKEQMKTALYYPLILGSMLLIIMSILIMKVLPIFKEVFEDMGIVATGFTKWIFESGSFIGGLIIVVLVIGWLLIFIGTFCAYSKKTQAIWKTVTSKSQLLNTVDLIRISSMLALVIKSGQDFESALKHSTYLAKQPEIKNKMMICEKEYQLNADLMEALNKSALFHPLLRKNLVLAMQTGTLEKSLIEVAEFYENELSKKLTKKLAIIEPASVGLISCMVGSVLLAVMFPLMNLMRTIF